MIKLVLGNKLLEITCIVGGTLMEFKLVCHCIFFECMTLVQLSKGTNNYSKTPKKLFLHTKQQRT